MVALAFGFAKTCHDDRKGLYRIAPAQGRSHPVGLTTPRPRRPFALAGGRSA
ncbi:hypothetical protein ACFXMT_18635 [Streptomyces mirabilis]|uniref:hypothetical protein n=1 Tax=Streptomyces mirabilis TaxID=68239 RepID=UPI0036B5B9D7